MDRGLNGAAAPTAYINRIGTAVPAYDVHQAFIDFAQTLLIPRQQRLFERMAALGGVAYQYLSHRDELGETLKLVRERFGAKLGGHAAELEDFARICVPDILFQKREMHLGNVDRPSCLSGVPSGMVSKQMLHGICLSCPFLNTKRVER